MQALKLLFSPMVFALGFLAPLISECLTAAGVSVAGIPDVAVELVAAAAIGGVAQLRGGWLWHGTPR